MIIIGSYSIICIKRKRALWLVLESKNESFCELTNFV